MPQAIHKALWGQGGADAPLERIIAACAENGVLDTLMEATRDAQVQYDEARKVYDEINSGLVLLPTQREELRVLIEKLGLEEAELVGLARESHGTGWPKNLPGDFSRAH